jgi:serine/alanine adding enzyme
MLTIETNHNKIDKGLWAEFVQTHPFGNIFQTPVLFDFYAQVPGYTPQLLSLIDDKGKLEGILLSVLQKESNFIKARLSSRVIVYGGPLIKNNNPENTVILLDAINRQLSGKAIYIEFRNLFDTCNLKPAFNKCGYRFREHINYIVPIISEVENKNKLSKSKLRQIKTTLNTGVSIKAAEIEKQVLELYLILKKLYKEKVKKPLPPEEFFIEFFKRPDLGKILVIEKDNKVIGGIVCPIYDDNTIYEWFVCGLDSHVKNAFPSVLATWSAIEYGIKNKFKSFDFLGAGAPNADYGVREFKAKFGGDMVSYGRYLKINNLLLYNLGKVGLKLLGLLKLT